jgi:4-hydroxy-tetrahydrodipicolinate synthase
MPTRGARFAGMSVAIVTPFRNGAVDYAELDRLVDWHAEQGTDGLVPCGTTGESPTLDHAENDRVIAAVCERAAGRLLVIAGTGSNSTAEAVQMTRHAKESGADASLQVGPYYNKPTQEGYYRHFATIADAVDLPQILYNIPGRTGSNILPETVIRLAEEVPQVVGIKEATASLDQVSQIAGGCDLTVLSGDDSLTLPIMSVGGEGVVSVVGNVVPQDMLGLVRAHRNGRPDEALRWHRKLFPLCRDLLGVATNPIPVKTALKLLGRGTGELRLPMCPLDAAGEARIRQTLINYGLTPIAERRAEM